MNIDDVMDEIADAARTIEGLRVYPWNADNVQPPALIIDLPQHIDYDVTMRRGTDRCVVPGTLVVGRVSDRTSSAALAPYISGGGPKSVKAAVEGHTYTACDVPVVTGVDTAVVTIAGTQLLGALYDFDVSGRGE